MDGIVGKGRERVKEWGKGDGRDSKRSVSLGKEQVGAGPRVPQGTAGCCSNLHVMYFCSITDAGDAIMNIPTGCSKVSTELQVFVLFLLPYATAAPSLRPGHGRNNRWVGLKSNSSGSKNNGSGNTNNDTTH